MPVSPRSWAAGVMEGGQPVVEVFLPSVHSTTMAHEASAVCGKTLLHRHILVAFETGNPGHWEKSAR